MQISLNRSKIGMLVFLLMVYSQTSCLEAEERPVNFGPEVPEAEVMKAINDSRGKMSHRQIGEHEKNETTTIAVDPQGNRYLIQVNMRDVLRKNEDANNPTVTYTSKLTEIRWVDGKEQKVEVEKNEMYAKFEEAEENFAANSLSEIPFLKVSSDPAEKVTFHDLKVTPKQRDLPSKVKDKANCANIPNCMITVTEIRLTQVVWKSTGPEKHDVLIVTAKDTPFYSKVLQYCDGNNLKDDLGRSIYIIFCQETTDFDYGKPFPFSETTP
ncbi:MAG: hypothetical protein A4S09_09720 [Proteobacteria bacterium SG_bin7]|nr:MAG: hypothetical protein A4S09_09720 [Proteobacteria bacterium SG_bin7]